MDIFERTINEVRCKAAELRESFGDEARARAIEWVAQQFETALKDRADDLPVRPANGKHEIVVRDRSRIYDPITDARAIGSRR